MCGCCNKTTMFQCRESLACSWVASPRPPPLPPPPPPLPPPPPPLPPPPPDSATAVFAQGGAWDAFATTNKRTNAYISAILSTFVYDDENQTVRSQLMMQRLCRCSKTEWRNRWASLVLRSNAAAWTRNS
ncbi:hypothetical protein PLESTB_001519000 [Pleodorina starrii]|uniref:Uncharacterized protein n=1 Tax=Pleodorina starrii TaxID=330485 RepID=A0A9W6BWQ1_9CHLO|nr:hypothetical protein PLESTB_001519000 [Pleodorina starrii]